MAGQTHKYAGRTLLAFLSLCVISIAGVYGEAETERARLLEDLLVNLEALDADPSDTQRLLNLAGGAPEGIQWNLDSPEVQHFESKIRPVLLESCVTCHGGDKTSANLDLTTREALIKGGERGPAIDLENPEDSLLLKAIGYGDDDLQMPPKEKLPDPVIKDFFDWVRSGAAWPQQSPNSEEIEKKAQTHWAFYPVEKTTPPNDPSGWAESDIDRWVKAKLDEKGLTPGQEAGKRTLARRLYFDLIGLPPTPREMNAFLNDDSADAYSKLVERLLESPHYGERWGRHWMDIVRYADTAGDSADYPVPELRGYRDYIIDSFNRDKPYNQFVMEQIAGDLLAKKGPKDHYAEQVIATGFIALSRRFGTTPYQTMHEVYEDTIQTMGRAFMGLTLKCARCHDHKFDPITDEDYYALYGFFSSTQYPFAGSETSISKDDYRQHFVPLDPGKKTEKRMEEYHSRVEELRSVLKYLQEESPLKEEVDKYEGQVKSLEKAISLSEGNDDFDGEPLKEFLEVAKKNRNEVRDRHRKKVREKEQILKEVGFPGVPPDVPSAYAVTDSENPADTHLQKKGEPRNRGDLVPRNVPAVLRLSDTFQIPEGTSGRLQLAEWLTDERHPLTARVMANRIWQYHFGKGIVQSPSNFGVMGEDPTHPELLDWLATAFIDSGWSIKAMHRLIVHSKTYRMTSEHNPANAEIDPKNNFLWRYEPRRLDAESIRDTMLATSGMLDRGRGGPHPFPPMKDWRYTQHAPFQEVYPSTHRSVYLMVPRFQRHPFLGLFDGPDPNRSTGKRPESTVPLQALFFMNNESVHQWCDAFGKRIYESNDNEVDRIDFAYQTALSRAPLPQEIELTSEYLAGYREKLKAEGIEGEDCAIKSWGSMARVLFSSNEFLYLD